MNTETDTNNTDKPNSVNIGIWNISGLKSKLEGICYDVEHNSFIEFLRNFDILCFLETWADTFNQFNLDGYTCYESIREKHSRAFRNSGGLAVFVKKHIYDIFQVKRLKSASENLIWLKFEVKTALWDYGFNFIVGFVYMSPEGSSIHSEENLFQIIEQEIAVFKDSYFNHKYIVGGDFNAYTNTYPDYVQFDSVSYVIENNDYIEDMAPPNRCNLDNRDLNSYGKALLDMCKTTGLRIINGRFGKDIHMGNFTCITGNSASVID